MARQSEPTPWARDLVKRLRQAITPNNDFGLPAISHRLPITPVGSSVPQVFTLDLAPDERGTFLVTCREMPDVALFEDTEAVALVRAEALIVETLASRGASASFPY